MTHDKPGGVAAAQAVATDIGRLAELESRPAAWATFYPNGSTASVYTGRQPPNAEPLYRSPTLTEAERAAIEAAIAYMAPVGNYNSTARDTLLSLLERTAN